MSNFELKTLVSGGKEKRVDTSASTFDFTAVRIGVSNLTISESSGKFDLQGKVLGNIAAATASGQAVEFAQLGTALALYVPLASVGAANGVAGLDGGGKVPVSQLPNSIMEYQGTWNANTNTPSLVDGTGNKGDVYKVTVAGSHDFGSGALAFLVGDYAIYNGTTWESAHAGADAVQSVNGQAGVVVLSTSDVAEGSNLYYTAARFNTAFAAKSTTDLAEGTNLYYTAARFDTAFATKSTSDLAEGSNLYFTNARFDARFATAFAAKSTTDLTEGSNLYYTAARFNTAFAAKSTADLTEGSNLYFTAARAKAAAVANAISSGVTDVAPSQDAVFQALALKADAAGSTFSAVNDNASAITVRQIVYVKSNGHVDLAVATNGALFDGDIGIVFDASIAATATGKVVFNPGAVSGFTGLTPGKKYYVSRTAAGGIDLYANISWVAGDEVVCVGKALSATVLQFAPEFEYEY